MLRERTLLGKVEEALEELLELKSPAQPLGIDRGAVLSMHLV